MARKKQKPARVDAQKLSLSEWLAFMRLQDDQQPEAFENYCFPTDDHREEYLQTIGQHSDSDIRILLRQFLPTGGGLGIDRGRMLEFARRDDFQQIYETIEYVRRLFNQTRHTWEGMSWVIDLLPDFPARAIEAISSYDLAHMQFLPDGKSHGLADAIDVIRAKYLEAITEQNLAATINPRDFEFLIAALYSARQYEVSVTRQSRDGGHDILAIRDTKSANERLLIECKCALYPIAVTTVRQLRGTLEEFNATSGVLVTTSRFTSPAYQFAKKSARIQLLDHDELCKQMNFTFGPKWVSRTDRIVRSGMAASVTRPIA
jgi:restriction system protein